MPPKGWRKPKVDEDLQVPGSLYEDLSSSDYGLKGEGERRGDTAERLGLNKRKLERNLQTKEAIIGIEAKALDYIANEKPAIQQFLHHFRKDPAITSGILYGLLSHLEKKGSITPHEGLIYITYDGQVELERLESSKTPWLSKTWGPRIDRMLDEGMDY